MVAGDEKYRRFETQLRELALARRQLFSSSERYVRWNISAAIVHTRTNAVFQRSAGSRRDFEHDIETVARAAHVGHRDHIAAMDSDLYAIAVRLPTGSTSARFSAVRVPGPLRSTSRPCD